MISKTLLPEFQGFLLTHRLAPEKNVPFLRPLGKQVSCLSNKTEYKDIGSHYP